MLLVCSAIKITLSNDNSYSFHILLRGNGKLPFMIYSEQSGVPLVKPVNLLDYAVILCYFLFILGVGVYFMRLNKGGRQYFAGGSMIPWWMSGMTLYMSGFTAWTFTGAAGFAYTTGWFTFLYFSVGPLAGLLGTLMTASRWRRTRSISPVEYTHTRFNVTTQQLLSWVIGINFTLSAGVQLASTCKLLSPLIGVDMTVIVLVTGVIIMIYTLLGGIWAVSVTDVVQGIILLSITFIVLPLSLSLVGGIKPLLEAVPPLQLEHTYNGVHYTGHWLVSIFMIGMIGLAAGGAQRFYSVKDERDARRVGIFASLLGLTVPLVFIVPPLVAKVYWPDLAQVEFFRPYLDKNPQDLVYVALCMKLLPNGLIGVFVAAMLSATMSTLSSVYNMVSSIVARDMIQGLFRPQMNDAQLLRVGRIASLSIGAIVTTLAVIFVNSQIGIFNLMQAFFTLFNIPVVVPIAFGLIFRKVPKWSAVGAITWGLVGGVTTRYVLGWDIGPQVYLSLALTFGIFSTAHLTGRLYARHRAALVAVATVLAAGTGTLFQASAVPGTIVAQEVLLWGAAFAIGGSLVVFARLFAAEGKDERDQIEEFFRKLDTPVDVEREVYGPGRKQITTLPLVGWTTIVMGAMMGLIYLTDLTPTDRVVVGALITVMIGFGIMMLALGRRKPLRPDH